MSGGKPGARAGLLLAKTYARASPRAPSDPAAGNAIECHVPPSHHSRAAAAPGPTQRQLRAGELVRHALVEILREEDLRRSGARRASR